MRSIEQRMGAVQAKRTVYGFVVIKLSKRVVVCFLTTARCHTASRFFWFCIGILCINLYYFFLIFGLATSSNKINPEPLIAIGYFLCAVAVVMMIGISIMIIKLKKINNLNEKNKRNLNL